MDFKNVPGSQSVTNYNNAIITETKELMSTEVDNMLQNSKSIVDSIPYHNNVISACEGILKDLNPRFAKEKERDEDKRLSKREVRNINEYIESLKNDIVQAKREIRLLYINCNILWKNELKIGKILGYELEG